MHYLHELYLRLFSLHYTCSLVKCILGLLTVNACNKICYGHKSWKHLTVYFSSYLIDRFEQKQDGSIDLLHEMETSQP